MSGQGAHGGGWQWVAAAQQGDREAFGQLYRRYAPEVSRFVSRRVRDHALVEDLTSETFTRAWKAVGSVREQGRDVGAWLITIARNLICDHTKSLRVQRETVMADLTDFETTAPGVDEVVITRLAAAEVGRRIGVLPPAQREVIRLRFGHQLSLAQTAAVVGRSQAAVKALQRRGLTQLLRTTNDQEGGGERR